MGLTPRVNGTLAERFWSKVDKAGPVPEYRPDLGPCWIWIAGRNKYGYAWLGTISAHIVSYELHCGPIPKGLQIDHLCRVRHCVNPNHLEAVTPRTNILRGISPAARHAQVTACPAGHRYDLFNTRIRPGGKRDCYQCHLEANRNRRRQRQFEEASQ